MYYGYFDNNEIVAPVQMCPRFNDIGAWHTLSNEQRREHGWYVCNVIDDNKDSRLFHRLVESKIFDNNLFTVKYSYIEKDIETVRNSKLQELKYYWDSLMLENYTIKGVTVSIQNAASLFCSGKEYVYFEQGTSIIRLSPFDVIDLKNKLKELEYNLYTIRYNLQERIKNSDVKEDIINLDVTSDFDNQIDSFKEVNNDG